MKHNEELNAMRRMSAMLDKLPIDIQLRVANWLGSIVRERQLAQMQCLPAGPPSSAGAA